MKKMFALLLTVCLLGSLAATALAEEPVTITILHYMGNEVKLNAFNKILEGYIALHPNVTFDSQALSQNEYITQLRTRVGAGDAPDQRPHGREHHRAEADRERDRRHHLAARARGRDRSPPWRKRCSKCRSTKVTVPVSTK